MVSLCVEALGRRENVSWAIFDTVAAALAPVLDDVDLSLGNHYFTGIQGNAPEFHVSISPRLRLAANPQRRKGIGQFAG